MNTNTNPLKYLLLYIPFILAWMSLEYAHLSYFISWLGSFYIFYICYKGIIKPLPTDLKMHEQFMRPIFLMQIIFAGYMACTSIFYYLNALGYEYFDYTGNSVMQNFDLYQSIAKCQLYYVLAHAALANGILVAMKYPLAQKTTIYTPSMSNLLLGISIFCLPAGYIFGKIGGLNQFSVQLTGLSFVAGTIALAFAIQEQRKTNFWLAGLLFIGNLINALSSGFKEPIIICVLLLGVFLLPIYGRKIIPLFGAILICLFFVLPTFIGNFRKLASQGTDAVEARDKSIDAVFNSGQDDLKEDNWAFLVFRLSEIDMFIKYTNSTPSYVPYYKTQLLKDAVYSIIPRFFWPNKPIVEQQVMERVYKARVVDQSSIVSAKPAFVVDCYLSYGKIGIWLGLFFYGFVAQKISSKAETLFGGYFMGSAVMFAGLFQIFWRGNSFEFLVNAVFWSYITMYIFYTVLKAKGVIEKV